MGAFWEAVGSKLADRWLAVCGATLLFEIGGALAWAQRHGGLVALRRRVDASASHPAGGVLTIALIVLVTAAAGLLVERATLPLLRLLEGDWPRFTAPLRDRLAARFAARELRLSREFQQAAAALRANSTPAADQRAAQQRLTRLTRAARRLPGPDRHMPTRIGNILRAAESRPFDRYGLDAVSVWPHLWLLLPEPTKAELANSRAALNRSVAAAGWGVLFIGFGVWSPWAPPVGLAVAAIALLLWAPSRAEVYADLVSAAFDLHRRLLYEQLHWPLPENPQHERQVGAELTTYLVRGLSRPSPTFTR